MKDYTCPTGPTFLDGVLLVASAIPDAGLVFRGSTCVEERIRQTLRPHTRGGNLDATSGGGRLALTMDPYTVSVMGTEDRVEAAAEQLAARAGIKLILLASLSRYTLTGEKLEPLARTLGARFPEADVQALSTRSLTRDHGDAFRAFYNGTATRLIARGLGTSTANTVGLIGYPWTRDSGDCRGDIAELRRLVEALGLTWAGALLDGRPSAAFREVAEAGTLVAFPDGAAAATAIAGATGGDAMLSGVPVSLEDTGAWLLDLAGRTGRRARAGAVIDAELRRVEALLDRVVHRGLMGRRAVVAATGEWLPGLVRCLQEDLGVVVTAALARTRHRGFAEAWDAPAELHLDTSVSTLNDAVDRARSHGGLDLIIGSNWERNALEAGHRSIPFVEFGYPQQQIFFLRSTPHLGYDGVLTWAERLLTAINARA
ncbi:MAG: nitrogenase component 1 [Pseudomonadota bacterium]